MDARIGYPNEHLAGDSEDALSSPSYATAVGLLMEALTKQTEEEIERSGEFEEAIEEVEETQENEEKSKRVGNNFFKKFTEGLKDFLDNAE